MTTKDLELIAGVLRRKRDYALDIERAYGVSADASIEANESIVFSLARELAAADSRFKRGAFLRACGVKL